MTAYSHRQKAILLLEDGRKFEGYAIGYSGITSGEICFTTGMTGYQEIFTDPSFAGQVVTMTNVHIGNYGVSNKENQSDRVQIAGLIVRNFSDTYSRIPADASLQEYLEENRIVGIAGIDTRALVRHIRSKGAMNCVISTVDADEKELKNKLVDTPSMAGCELASLVSVKESYYYGDENAPFKVAVIDYGCKRNILECFVQRGCYLKVFPARTDLDTIDAWGPDGYFLSNGPGDPAAMDYAIETARKILTCDKPVFGICLGHQLLALAQGMKTEKLKYGHRGVNHPVLNKSTGLGEITSQNHGFGVVKDSLSGLEAEVEISHYNLNDGSLEGLKWKNKAIFTVQYHPESSPGPFDSRYLFDEYIEVLKIHKGATASIGK